ncbi:hypothetical protein [Paradesulfitobacterium ferrireducens]|uniref:hypothetical protein n=1 Tax=Paradesulfitobacterium ferrireducens TaxID=2816476 RepID=UPI001A90868A|nr:hypothetical protein [Paradesulfitobacterium ferrireducens]
MFKILRLIVIATIIITLAGCSVSSTEESKVKVVSQKYLTDSFEFNYQMTREMPGLQYVTSEFKEELTKRFSDLLTATTGANLIQRVLDLNLSSIQLSSETLANVSYEVKVNISTIIKPDYTETYKGTLYLRNKNGQWQVNGNQLENHDWILPSLPTIQKTIVLGEQEESEKLRIKLNASGFSSRNSLIQPLVENAEMVVLIAYPESAPAPFY